MLASAAGGDVEILKYGSPPKALPEIGWSQIFIDKSNKDFVFKGLGSNGQEILKEENKKYIDKTFFKRKLLINKLFELLDN